MTKTVPPLLIALKPQYADMVFEGLKTAELRRRIPSHVRNRDVYIYVSSPAMELRGGFRVGEIWTGSPDEIWTTVSHAAGVSKQTFNDYYDGLNVAFALEILDVWEFANPIPLGRLRERIPAFVVPQSYRYAKPAEFRWFDSRKKISLIEIEEKAS